MSFGTWVVEKHCPKVDSRINIQDIGIVARFNQAKLSKFRRDFLLTNKQTRFVIFTLM
jgi:hypothetical protein